MFSIERDYFLPENDIFFMEEKNMSQSVVGYPYKENT
jgi:hypothetical protein